MTTETTTSTSGATSAPPAAGTAAGDTTLPLAPGRWALDAAHSVATFSIRHLGISKVHGRFNTFDATLDVGEGPDDTSVEAVIDVRSIDTGNADRDAHMHAPEFLDVDAHPEIRFASTRITGAGADWLLQGEATVHGVTRPFGFEVEFGGVGDFMGRRHAGFTARGELRRSDFGLAFPPPAKLALGEVVRFELDLQFIEPDGA